MRCNFSIDGCDPECKKYALCSLEFQQKQLIEVKQQISVLLEAMNNVIKTIDNNKKESEENLNNYTAEILKLIQNV